MRRWLFEIVTSTLAIVLLAVGAAHALSGSGPLAQPTNTVVPVISGTAEEGKVLSSTQGTWTWGESISSFTYKWERCSGSVCSLTGGAGSTYSLTGADVGKTVRVQVSAHAAHGTGYAWSTPTGTVVAGGGGGGGGEGTGCFEDPTSEGTTRLEAAGCEFAGFNNAGAGAVCSAGTVGAKVVGSGETLSSQHIAGKLNISGSNVTISKVCMDYNGGAGSGETAVYVSGAGTNIVFKEVTIRGKNASSEQVAEAIAAPEGSTVTIEKSLLYNCGECIHFGNGGTIKLKKTLVDANSSETGGHFEDSYSNTFTGQDTIEASEGSTLLNPHGQTATIFNDTRFGGGGVCNSNTTITHSLIAGGGASIYPCGNATESGGSYSITNNHFARCTGTPISGPGGEGKICTGETFSPSTTLQSPISDGHGYYVNSGFYQLMSYFVPAASKTWESNVWDNNLETVPSP